MRQENENSNSIDEEVYSSLKGWHELFNAPCELGYLWDVKDRLIEEHEIQVSEKRGLDPGHECL
jgi:hypothetical protein